MMDKRPLVSVLVPLYNQERYFETCIRSICGQSYDNLATKEPHAFSHVTRYPGLIMTHP